MKDNAPPRVVAHDRQLGESLRFLVRRGRSMQLAKLLCLLFVLNLCKRPPHMYVFLLMSAF